MSLTIKQLRYFVATAELGQISRAAIELSISQSAVTTAIRDMEELLGVSLFDRSAQGVSLTDAGRGFLAQARNILGILDEAMKIAQIQGRIEARLKIAVSYTVMGYFMPHHLQRLARLFPSLDIDLFELNREAIEEGVIANHYDLAILLTSNIANPELASETFVTSPRRLWVAANHPLLKQSDISLRDVATEPYILLTVDDAARTSMRYWSASPYSPKTKIRTSAVEAVRSMVANGTGVTILSDMVYRPWSLEGRRIETIMLTDSIPAMTIGMAWKKEKEFSPAMRAVRDYFRQAYLAPQMHTR